MYICTRTYTRRLKSLNLELRTGVWTPIIEQLQLLGFNASRMRPGSRGELLDPQGQSPCLVEVERLRSMYHVGMIARYRIWYMAPISWFMCLCLPDSRLRVQVIFVRVLWVKYPQLLHTCWRTWSSWRSKFSGRVILGRDLQVLCRCMAAVLSSGPQHEGAGYTEREDAWNFGSFMGACFKARAPVIDPIP